MESRSEKRLRCWESVFPKGVIEACCPVCRCSTIRYSSTSGNTFQQLHIVPATKSGSDQSWNLVPGCGCNQNMRHMNLVDWMGTRGNKKELLKDLFLRKYKSLVAPCKRTTHDKEQLIKWVYATYHPLQLEEYRDWMILLEQDLATMQSNNEEEVVVVKDECIINTASIPQVDEKVKHEGAQKPVTNDIDVLPTIPLFCSGQDNKPETKPTKEEEVTRVIVLERPSPYFADPSRYKSRDLKHRLGNIHAPYPV